MTKKPTRINGIDNRLELLAIFLLIIVAVPALISGWNFIDDISGKTVGLNIEILKTTPFDDFFYPGLILFVVFGVLSVVVGVLTFFDVPYYKWFVSLQGLLLIGWLSAEVFYGLFEPNLHIPFYFIGFFLLVIGVLLKLRKRTFI